MTIESADDRAAFLVDDGVAVTWTRGAVVQSSFLALFDRPSTVVAHDDGPGALNRIATLSCPESYLPAGAAEGDAVAVAGQATSFACVTVQPDGTGWCLVELKRA